MTTVKAYSQGSAIAVIWFKLKRILTHVDKRLSAKT
jgi:hypothetical protein